MEYVCFSYEDKVMSHLQLECAAVLVQVAANLDQSFEENSQQKNTRGQTIGVNAYLNILQELNKHELSTRNSVMSVLEVVVNSKNPNLTKLLQLFGHLGSAVKKERTTSQPKTVVGPSSDNILGDHLRQTCLMAVGSAHLDSTCLKQTGSRVSGERASSQGNSADLRRVLGCLLFRD